MQPPEVEVRWEENHPWIQAKLLAFQMIREFEDAERAAALAGITLE